MRKLVVNEFMSLDSVVQAPMYPDEDTDGGFEHGGWHPRYFDDRSMQWTVDGVASAGGYVFGRRTYDAFAAHWPNASEEERPMSEPFNTRPKYVATTTLREPLAWQNSSVLKGDVSEAVRALKQSDGGDLHIHGSTRLVQQLLRDGVVDVLRLMIDPLVLGGGKRIFSEDGALSSFRLAESEVTSTGAILATYARADT